MTIRLRERSRFSLFLYVIWRSKQDQGSMMGTVPTSMYGATSGEITRKINDDAKRSL